MTSTGGRRLVSHTHGREGRAALSSAVAPGGSQFHDPDAVHAQSPCWPLDPLSYGYVNSIARALGITGEGQNAVSEDWRCVWTLGRWVYSNGLAVSCSLVQPVVNTATVIVHGSVRSLPSIRDMLMSKGAEASSVTIRSYARSSHIQGRYSLMAYHLATQAGSTERDPRDAVNFLNIGGSKFTFWLLYEGCDPVLAHVTTDSLRVVAQYLPEGFAFDTQASNKRGWKLMRSGQAGTGVDYSCLSLSPAGSAQFTGKPTSMEAIYSAFGVAVKRALTSPRSSQFIGSLQVLDIDQ